MRTTPLGRLLAALALAAFLTAAPRGWAKDGDVRIVHAYVGWRDAASFKRISEYFTGRENTGDEIVLRTHPDSREGYYFQVRLENQGAPVPVRLVIQVVTPDTAVPRSFTFNTDLSRGTSLLDLGLTGADWPDRKVNAVAWRLDAIDGTGVVLATDKSYLWEKPLGK